MPVKILPVFSVLKSVMENSLVCFFKDGVFVPKYVLSTYLLIYLDKLCTNYVQTCIFSLASEKITIPRSLGYFKVIILYY